MSSPHYKEKRYVKEELELYVPPFGCSPEIDPKAISDEKLLLLKDSMMNFLAEDKKEKVLLLKGRAGTGKSLFGCFLEKTFWEIFKYPEDPIFIFISLPQLKDPITNLMEEYFEKKFGATNVEKIINKLKKRARVYFFLDAVDEIPTFQENPHNFKNLYENNKLYLWDKAKFIMSCRT